MQQVIKPVFTRSHAYSLEALFTLRTCKISPASPSPNRAYAPTLLSILLLLKIKTWVWSKTSEKLNKR